MSDNLTERRRFLAACATLGLTQTLFPGAVLALASQAPGRRGAAAEDANRITAAMIDAAAAIAGITIAEDQKAAMLGSLNSQRDGLAAIRELAMPNSVPPSFVFDPVPGTMTLDTAKKPIKLSPAPKVAFAAGSRSPKPSPSSPSASSPSSSAPDASPPPP